jgi:excisionase family DNA binding protein
MPTPSSTVEASIDPSAQRRVANVGSVPDFTRETFMTVAEVAAALKLNQQTIRNLIDQGTLPALHVGRRVRVRRSDFDTLVERGRTAEPAAAERSPEQAFWAGELLPVAQAEGQ